MIKPKCLHKIVMINIYKIEKRKELLSFVAPGLKKSEASKTPLSTNNLRSWDLRHYMHLSLIHVTPLGYSK